MKGIAVILAFAALGAGLWSAWLWWQSSRIIPVPLYARLGCVEPADGSSGAHWIDGLLDAGMKSGALNRKAAVWTGLCVLLGALSNVVGAIAP